MLLGTLYTLNASTKLAKALVSYVVNTSLIVLALILAISKFSKVRYLQRLNPSRPGTGMIQH